MYALQAHKGVMHFTQ